MTVRIKLFLLLGTLLILTLSPAMAQDLPLPPALNIGEEKSSGANIAEIRIIGWSPDGKLAYMTSHFEENVPAYDFHYAIVNLVDDRLVWQSINQIDEWELDEGLESGGELRSPLESSWAGMQGELIRELDRFGIVVREVRELHPFPGTVDGEEFRAEERILRKGVLDGGQELGDWEFSSLYELHLLSSERGGKVVSQIETAGFSSPGYLLSPFEPRMALLGQSAFMSYVERDLIVQYRFFGSDLTKGFVPE
ncbi:MAG: hypothetical protein PQJ60_14465 [Spirochaetales bacterium]|nr:hypothetical protein [Spirochaetales bacterium]